MTGALNQYIPTNAVWADKNGRLTASAQMWLRELWLRAGGTSSMSLSEIEAALLALIEGHTIQDEGVALIQRAVLNFVGTGVSVIDLAGKTTVAIDGLGNIDGGHADSIYGGMFGMDGGSA